MDEPYRRPTREEIAERVRARDAMMPGPDWLWRREMEEFGGDPEPAPPRQVSRCGACGYQVTAVGHKIACG